MDPGAFEDIRYTHDGLQLAARIYGRLDDARLPLVCLSGLTRNARDFHSLAVILRGSPQRRPVIAFDYRGRGRSDHAARAEDYTVPAEAADIAAGLDHLGVTRAIFLGTSRGALVIQILAASRPDLLAGAIFNDAGPRIEAEGLRQIRDTVGRVESFPDWNAAVDAVVAANRPAFPALSRDDFERFARAAFIERGGRIVGDYDPQLLEPLATMDLGADLPELWDLFAIMRAVPMLVIRGETSMLFAEATVDRMAKMHPDLQRVTVAGQGHAPMLETGDLPASIAGFVERIDG
ncbi:alpha/beta fold hydrolase [Jiella sp. M17.18]|uniref:alpha/beta fold hydrolase n=1 Tax=Jiella sp. M17.18 TaxID=3234247 RepID=UPI0034E04264